MRRTLVKLEKDILSELRKNRFVVKEILHECKIEGVQSVRNLRLELDRGLRRRGVYISIYHLPLEELERFVRELGYSVLIQMN